MPKIRLFCLPYAGGSAMMYVRWKELLHDGIELCPVELTGRGTRMSEPIHQSFEEMLDDVFLQVQDRLDVPYAIFGHSMGSWLAFELAHKIVEQGLPAPAHLFFSARRAPQVPKEDIAYHELPLPDLMRELEALGGASQEMFENETLLKLFLPTLLADFKVLYEYRYIAKANKLPCSISVLSGKTDTPITGSDLLAWKALTEVSCRIHKLSGGHFFINENTPAVVEVVNAALGDSML
ncbi:thioesterase II family protein [Tumebacillus permanentifrigoris]|uniref:Surfactin synthase thioesterase subunit n=1 Tax=Tumebacillus permanentifrigoris TaxID=378543 RepID=A0A316D4I0_9BACL|nr:alpha/beta fold hydrolase [Tumebacillus permanentifrigoris]PWK05387.1 surfactin synthase thioesterase subunit [Tumebacillus permanentifrigoris]